MVLFSKVDCISKSIGLEEKYSASIDVPQIKSRISVLITKVRMLDLYIHLDIPDDKVVVSITEIIKNWLQRQMDKIVEKSKFLLNKENLN
jgi:hypothetical protein